ncbi:hypothetical protein D3C71_1152920 [compost metagenome]
MVAVLPGHAVHHVGGAAGGAIAPAVGHAAGLLDVVAVVVAVGIAVGERPARQQAGAAGQRGVAVQQCMQARADEVIRIEAVFAMQQGGLVGLAQVVAAIAPGVAQHAPAARTEQHRGGIGAVALFPAAGIGDLQFAALELETAVLLATAIEVFIGLAGEHLHALRGVQVQRLQLAPQRHVAAVLAPVQRQPQRLPLDVQHQGRGADAHFGGVLFQPGSHAARRLRQHDRRRLVAGPAQAAVASGLHAQHVLAQQVHAQQRAVVGTDVPARAPVLVGGGGDTGQVAQRRGHGRRDRQRGKQCHPQASTSKPGFHLAPKPAVSGNLKPVRPTLGQALERCQQIAKKKEGYFL